MSWNALAGWLAFVGFVTGGDGLYITIGAAVFYLLRRIVDEQ